MSILATLLPPKMLSAFLPEEMPAYQGYLTKPNLNPPYSLQQVEDVFHDREPGWSHLLKVIPVSNEGESLARLPETKAICNELIQSCLIMAVGERLVVGSRPFVMRGSVPMGLKLPEDEDERTEYLRHYQEIQEPLMTMCIRLFLERGTNTSPLIPNTSYYQYLQTVNQPRS